MSDLDFTRVQDPYEQIEDGNDVTWVYEIDSCRLYTVAAENECWETIEKASIKITATLEAFDSEGHREAWEQLEDAKQERRQNGYYGISDFAHAKAQLLDDGYF